MARIPEEEIERLKREVSLVRLAEARGIELAPHGKDLVGRCPWHAGGEEKTPSLVISPDKNLFNCLGACQSGGSPIDWVMRMEGASFRHAVELLREGYPSLKSLSGRDGKAHNSRKLPSPVAADAGDADILHQVVAYYHETLKASPEALAYLAKRGIRNDAAINVFKLGFANRTLGLRLPIRQTKDGERIVSVRRSHLSPRSAVPDNRRGSSRREPWRRSWGGRRCWSGGVTLRRRRRAA